MLTVGRRLSSVDLRSLYDGLQRDPRGFPLFERVWNVLTFAPSSKHVDEEEMISLVWDAFDYLQASGEWHTESTSGVTSLFWDGTILKVREEDDQSFNYEHTFTLQ
jgi:hypothetical protein